MMRWVLPEASAEALLDSENRSVAVASDTPASLATSWMVDFPTVRPPCDVATAFMDAATFTIRGVPRRFGMPYAAFARRIRHAGVRGVPGEPPRRPQAGNQPTSGLSSSENMKQSSSRRYFLCSSGPQLFEPMPL